LWVAVFSFGKSPPVDAKKNNGNVVWFFIKKRFEDLNKILI
jgi:hypothetical protein